MNVDTTEEHITEELPFDETTPEPDTKIGGRFIVAVLILSATLVVIWALLGGLYSATMAETTGSNQVDFRLRQVLSSNQEYLDAYREYQPEDNETKIFQIPVGAAKHVLLDNPELLAHMPGTTPNTAVPVVDVELPDPPSLPSDAAHAAESTPATDDASTPTDGSAAEEDEPEAAPSDTADQPHGDDEQPTADE